MGGGGKEAIYDDEDDEHGKVYLAQLLYTAVHCILETVKLLD